MNRQGKGRRVVCYPSVRYATPLLVVGPPRCGTRFVTNVLNKVPGVVIHGEIHNKVVQSLFKVIETCNKVYETKGRPDGWTERWNVQRHDFLLAAWANLTKGHRKKSPVDCLYYGYKTPRHEKYFDVLNRFFAPIHPHYVCCIRNFCDHLLSVQACWPKVSSLEASLKYIQSLRHIRYMKQQRPKDVHLFFLDDYIGTGLPYLTERLFVPLGLQDTNLALAKAREGAVNTSAHLGVQRKEHLSQAQRWLVTIFPMPLREFSRLRRDFGR